MSRTGNSNSLSSISRLIDSWCQEAWYGSPSVPPRRSFIFPLLSLGARLYSKGLHRDQQKMRSRARRLPVPVISVGNLTVGGTGKTPFTLWLARYLAHRGHAPAILSRGYGGRSEETARVPLEGDTMSKVARFGDEPVLLSLQAENVPVWVGKERWKSGQAAIQTSGANVLILDDGFQHLSLERDLDLVLADTNNPFGNGFLLPRGPLREPVERLDRADAIILTRADDERQMSETISRVSSMFPGKPVFASRHQLIGLRRGLTGPMLPLEMIQGRPAVAFAGIAHPAGFFHSLQTLGMELRGQIAFPDHRAFDRSDLELILNKVRKTRAEFIVTTGKDCVRLPPLFRSISITAEIEISFGSQLENFRKFLNARIVRDR
jgi:tetraacyldisaccharide 4'-kinase